MQYPPKILDNAVAKVTKQVVPWITAEDPADAVITLVRSLMQSQASRLSDNVRLMSLYANDDYTSSLSNGDRTAQPRICDNQIKKHVDTLVGKLTQANSRVKMMTSQGDFSAWQTARKKEAALEGEWLRMKFYRKAQQVATDGVVTGTGALKLYIHSDGDHICADRVYPNEIFVDDVETAYGAPTKMYQLRYVAKDTLAALYPDKVDVVTKATAAPMPPVTYTMYRQGLVEVCEAWALPVGDRPGRRVICTSGGTLVDEEYKDEFFPFVIFKPYDMPIGWYGQGLVCQVETTQRHLNDVLETMRQGARMGIAPYWIVPEGSEVNFKHLDNRVGTIVKFSGGEPKWITNPPFHQAAPVYCQMLRTEIADMFGNNQMDTGGDPTINRLDSKRALKEYQAMGASRISTLYERWSNDFALDAAERTMMLARRIAKQKGGYPVLVPDLAKKVVQLNWKELEDSPYILRPAPANLLSASPSAKLDQLTEMLQAGLITQKQAQRQMQGSRDVDAMFGEASATEDDIDDLIQGIVERGEYRPPSSFQNLTRGIVRVTDAYLQYRIRGVDEDKLMLFEQWLDDAQDVLLQMNEQQPQAPGVANEPTAAAPGAADIGAGPTGIAAPQPAVPAAPAPSGPGPGPVVPA